MNDLGLDGEVKGVSAQSAQMQAGAMLKGAREAQGLHIAALAVALKVPVRKLEALEAGQFDLLPDMVFVRSLALSVCRTLKVDPAPIMSSLPEVHINQFKTNDTGLNTSFKESPGTSHQGWLAQFSSPIGVGVLFLVVAIAVILAWPVKPLFEDESATSQRAIESMPPIEQSAQAPQALVSAEDGATALPISPPVTQQTAPVFADTAAPGKEVDIVSPTPASVPATVANNDSGGPLTMLELTGHGESWVQVTDGAGQSKLRKLMQSGEIIRLNGQLPLSVVVGRADNVAVVVRGKPMDLAPVARENVARFEVK